MAWTADPDPARGVGGPTASTSGASLGADAGAVVGALRDLLAAFFSAYVEDAPEVRKPQMTSLLAQAHAAGLIGPGALPSLAALFASLRAELDADGSKFSAFYHFIFFVARDKGQRNLPRATALDAWRFVLGGGRFTLLREWCDFVAALDAHRGISEDTWCQVLDFAVAVNREGGRLHAYDPHGAWPVLVDEFVDHMRGPVASDREDHPHAAGTSNAPFGAPAWRLGGGDGTDATTTAMDQSYGFAASDPRLVYNGGGGGGSGRGFGDADRWGGYGYESPAAADAAVAHDGAAGTSAAHRLRQPSVGCKRRLSAVLEMDGLADQLQRTRVRSPALPAGDAEALERHLANLAEARERSDLAGSSNNPITGSPARKRIATLGYAGGAGGGAGSRRRG
jgi:DCN1-like protein 1/2